MRTSLTKEHGKKPRSLRGLEIARETMLPLEEMNLQTECNEKREEMKMEGDGGNAETRTLDRRIKSPLLYQLSYVPSRLR